MSDVHYYHVAITHVFSFVQCTFFLHRYSYDDEITEREIAKYIRVTLRTNPLTHNLTDQDHIDILNISETAHEALHRFG